ncbi:hypothetical protein predicted by Glimmer/Critica [Bdellovibrio bacteriovorus HD100]|uniref:Uncharacterized protein n=1 Tax=Bdellovibrio bacteriovorus (strain ATCC 15356 / DSM 50701 / NCIMB 9529 / HD100) TaxID=264462 RepID=Q6MQN3_BDEBA|nr:hypothetical protein predicted by Glimmer/Critica [Bdellovibrio bacteriovorus HD100]
MFLGNRSFRLFRSHSPFGRYLSVLYSEKLKKNSNR